MSMLTDVPIDAPTRPRPWWRLALEALAAGTIVQLPVAIFLSGRVGTPWDIGVPIALGLAGTFSYHPNWSSPRWRRATIVHFVALFALGLAVVASMHRLGWWR